MGIKQGSEIIKSWLEESREAAQLVIDTYGEPHETTESLLVWHKTGPWKRIIATKEFYEHNRYRRSRLAPSLGQGVEQAVAEGGKKAAPARA